MQDEAINNLIKQAQGGDTSAFEKLIQRHEKIVFNIAYKMLSNAEDVKDISQDVFVKVYKNLPKFDGKSAFSTWIYRITVNTCIDEIRKRKGKETYSMDEEFEGDENSMSRQYEDEGPTPEEALIADEKKKMIMDGISRLSQEHKTVIVLRDIEGFSYTEITEITGMTLGTVKSRLARARLQLKNILIKQMELLDDGERHKDKKGGKSHEMQ